MLLPKGGINWKSAQARLPPTRAIWAIVTKTRFLLLLALTGMILLLWRGIRTSASEMQRYVFRFGSQRFVGLCGKKIACFRDALRRNCTRRKPANI